MNQTLTTIAQSILGLETLESRGSDSLDFHDLNVQAIREALEAAYRAGYRSGLAAAEPAEEADPLEGEPARHRYLVHLRSISGVWARYDGTVEVTAENYREAFIAAVRRLRQTSFPDRGLDAWVMDGIDYLGPA